MTGYKSNASRVGEILSQVGFYELTGSDGCLCAHIRLRSIEIDVHCWKSKHHFTNYWGDKFQCSCKSTGVHITPLEPEQEHELVKIGEMIREAMSRPDMDINIVIHEPMNASQHVGFVEPAKGARPKETIVPALAQPIGSLLK